MKCTKCGIEAKCDQITVVDLDDNGEEVSSSTSPLLCAECRGQWLMQWLIDTNFDDEED